MGREEFLNAIKGEVKKASGKRESKVLGTLEQVVGEMMSNQEATTIKAVTEKLGKSKNYGSYVRLLVSKSEKLEFVKINGLNVIVTR